MSDKRCRAARYTVSGGTKVCFLYKEAETATNIDYNAYKLSNSDMIYMELLEYTQVPSAVENASPISPLTMLTGV